VTTVHLEQTGLLLACAQAEEFDSTPWLILADWLEEHDDPRAEFLRLSRRGGFSGKIDQIALRHWAKLHGETLLADSAEKIPLMFRRGWLMLQSWQYGSIERLATLKPSGWPTRVVVGSGSTEYLAGVFSRIRHWCDAPEVRFTIDGGTSLDWRLLNEIPAIDSLTLGNPSHLGSLREPLRNLTGLRRLTVPPMDNRTPVSLNHFFGALAEADTLRELRILGPITPTDPAQWRAMSALRHLHLLEIRGMGYVDLANIDACIRGFSLRSLIVGRSFAARIAPHLSGWTQLVELELQEMANESTTTFESLINLDCLERLDLSILSGSITPALFAPLADVPRLRAINLDHARALTDACIATLSESQSLEELDISTCPRLSDRSLDALATMPTLRRVRVAHCPKITPSGRMDLTRRRPDIRVITAEDEDHVRM